ncbi:helix-turn-helix transcriptional regulator [Nesterenkonia cremea]|nr:WYL domain-containing protein [Nesterenkonia cremea]
MAHACRDRLRIRCRYRRRDGQSQQRTVEPVRMVAAGWRWYLMAFDLERQDWRRFRLDRMDQVEVTTFRFVPRDHPDPVQYIQASIAEAPYEHLTRVRLRAGVEELRREIPPQMGRIEPDAEPGWSLLVAGADDLDWMAAHLALLDVEVEVLEPPQPCGMPPPDWLSACTASPSRAALSPEGGCVTPAGAARRGGGGGGGEPRGALSPARRSAATRDHPDP